VPLREQLEPFLSGNLSAWRGLPEASPAEFDALFGAPAERGIADLGFYPAERSVYPADSPSGGVIAFARHDRVVLIQALRPPPVSAMQDLPAPCGIKGHEILVPGAYAHEYVYCGLGLVLTVARPFKAGGPDRIARCRGIRPIAAADDFGPEYYKAFEDQTSW
jgi:hypothetical protein